ncbi:violaxanthin de-epoxidase, chloroplastic, partial [Tanacetum coccineum]
ASVNSKSADRLKWVDENYEMLVFTDGVLESKAALQLELTSANILLIVSVTKQESVEWIQRYSRNIPNIVCFDSSPVLQNKLGGSFVPTEVKDNGVVSNKYWTIVDVPEDFSWGLFHYSGAARVAGQSYTGAVLLFDVDYCQCNDPPLGLPEGSRFTTTLTAIPSDNLGDSQATSRWDTFPWRLVVGELSLGNAR